MRSFFSGYFGELIKFDLDEAIKIAILHARAFLCVINPRSLCDVPFMTT